LEVKGWRNESSVIIFCFKIFAHPRERKGREDLGIMKSSVKKLRTMSGIILGVVLVLTLCFVNLYAAPVTVGNFVVDYVISSDWGTGGTVNVTLKNNGPAINGWTVGWTFPGNQTIVNIWNASYTQSGASVSVKDAGYNASLPTGGSTSFGFNYNGTNATPTSFTVNSSSTSTPTPTVGGTPTRQGATVTPTRSATPTPTRSATPTPTIPSGGSTYQAEDAVYGSSAVFESTNGGYNGTGYINFPSNGGYLEFRNVDGGAGGAVTLKIRNALGVTSSRTGRIQVNGGTWQNITFDPTGGWTTWTVKQVSVTLNSGTSNTIRLESTGQDLANIDELSTGAGGSTSTPTPTQGNTPTPTRAATPTPTRAATPTPTQGTVTGAIYVAPNGSASNPGTIDSPTTLTAAITKIAAGGTIYMRAGTYSFSSQITIARGNNGSSGALKKIFAYNSEKPVLDFSSQSYGDPSSVTNPRGLQIDGNYWHVKGLEVKGSADNGIYIGGNGNTIEMCNIHNNRDSGLQLGRYSSTAARNEWPSNNLILNCDSHENATPITMRTPMGLPASSLPDRATFSGVVFLLTIETKAGIFILRLKPALSIR
jgi:hypothetical protein